MIEIYALAATIIINMLLALISWLSGNRTAIHRLFTGFTVFLANWSFFSYVSTLDTGHQLFLMRIVMFIVVGMNSIFYFFARRFPNGQAKTDKQIKWKLILIGLALLITLSPFMFVGLSRDGNSVSPIAGPGMLIFLMHTIYFVSATIRLLLIKIKTYTGKSRRQVQVLFLGTVFLFVLLPMTNFVLPVVFGESSFVPYSSLYAAAFAGFISYSILRHQLFEIRLLVMRSLAYLLSLGFILTIYVLLGFALSQLFFTRIDLNGEEVLANITLLTLLTFSYGPIRSFFNRMTKQLFFRDTYDAQEVIDEISSLLATEIDLNTILTESIGKINSSLKPLYIRYIVFKDGENYVDQSIGNIKKQLPIHRSEVDLIPDIIAQKNTASSGERKLLSRHDMDALLKLRTNQETIGLIMLGPKQSGEFYSKRDINLLIILEKELAIAVQNSRYFEQIQEFNKKLQQEVMDATSELRATNDKLKALDEAKDEFISMASHQLRTPLTSVKGYISMVVEGDAGKISKDQRKLLEEAFASSQRMVYLIADLLNVSRLRTGKFVIEPSEVYLPDVVEQEVKQLGPIARSRKLKLSFHKPRRFPKVWLDETKTRQVVMNFIDNAIYYTPAGGTIDIKLISKKDAIIYSVTDNGIGVPKDQHANLFTKFFRADNARKARPDGTGLGLYMAQKVISEQGGSVVFESKEGKGSTFGFRFPVKSAKTKPGAQAPTTTKSPPTAPVE